MEELLDILKYVLPSLVVLATSVLIMKRFMDNEYRKQMLELKKNNQQLILPVRLQAYERLVLLMERIALPGLITRLHRPGMSARLLQAELIKHIREEFDHNVTQQLYVSANAWNTVKAVKDELIKLINNSTARLGPEADGLDLSKHILTLLSQTENTPNDMAISLLKKEAKYLF